MRIARTFGRAGSCKPHRIADDERRHDLLRQALLARGVDRRRTERSGGERDDDQRQQRPTHGFLRCNLRTVTMRRGSSPHAPTSTCPAGILRHGPPRTAVRRPRARQVQGLADRARRVRCDRAGPRARVAGRGRARVPDGRRRRRHARRGAVARRRARKRAASPARAGLRGRRRTACWTRRRAAPPCSRSHRSSASPIRTAWRSPWRSGRRAASASSFARCSTMACADS